MSELGQRKMVKSKSCLEQDTGNCGKTSSSSQGVLVNGSQIESKERWQRFKSRLELEETGNVESYDRVANLTSLREWESEREQSEMVKIQKSLSATRDRKLWRTMIPRGFIT